MKSLACVSLVLLFANLVSCGWNHGGGSDTTASNMKSPGDAESDYLSLINERDQLMLSAASYCSEDELYEWNCLACSEIDYISKGWLTYVEKTVDDSAGLVTYDPRKQAIVFAGRGTANPANWLSNLNAFSVEFEEVKDVIPGVLVHDGFYKFFQLMLDDVLTNVETLFRAIEEREKKTGKKQPRNLFINGHSRGGAIATLMGVYLVAKYKWDDVTYLTFGAPRVLNDVGVEYLAKNIKVAYRVTHYGDPVPWVPPVEGGYKHFGKEIFYNKQYSKFKVCESHDESVKQCSLSMGFLMTSIHDHTHYGNPEICVAHYCNKDDPGFESGSAPVETVDDGAETIPENILEMLKQEEEYNRRVHGKQVI